MPRVSIILTTHNRAHLLVKALAGVAAQTFTDYECVVVDDGSTDDTAATLAAWPHPIVALHRQHMGLPERSRLAGIAATTGELIAFLDDDDQWHPDYLARQVRQFDERPETGLAYSDVQFLLPDGSLSPPRLEAPHRDGANFLDNLLDGWAIYPSMMLFRRDLFEDVRPPPGAPFMLADNDLPLRLAWAAPVACTPQPLVVVRRVEPGLGIHRAHRFTQDALEILTQFAAAHPLTPGQRARARRTRARWHAHLGLAELASGRRAVARRHFGHSLRLQPGQRRAWLGLLQSLGSGRA